MTLTVKHASLTGAAANPDVLVDGPKWDADHTVTGLDEALAGVATIGARGALSMFPSSGQGSGAWNVVDPFGNAVSTTGTTTQGLQEAITAAKANNWPLAVIGRGTINCTTAITIPSLFFADIYIAPEVIVNFGALGAAALVTIDSQENGTLLLLGEFVQNSADTGDVILLKPTNTVAVTGNTGIFASTIDFGTIVPASAGASALHLDSTSGNIVGNRINTVDINGGVAGLKVTISAATPHVIQENQFSGQYWHGMSAYGVQMGTSTTNANFMRRNMFSVGRISPKANAAVGFSTFSNGDIIDIGGINAEEAPGGANLADGIVWQSGATGNYARVGQISVGTGASVLNSSGNLSNVWTVAGARVGGTIDTSIIGGTTPANGTFTSLTCTGTFAVTTVTSGHSIGAASPGLGWGLYHAGTISATTGFAINWQTDSSLTATANSDTLQGMRITATPVKGAFTSVTSYGLYIAGGSGIPYDFGIMVADTSPSQFGGKLVSVNPTAGLGYATGAGGSVTQATSRTTGVTLNKVCGAITLFAAAPAVGTWVSFTVTNSAVAATDVPHISFKSGTNTYIGHVSAVAAGSFQISFTSIVGTASDSAVINFDIMKAATS